MIVYAVSSDSVKGRFKRELLKWSKLAEVDRVLCRCFTARGKPVTGPTIIEKVKSFYDAIKITDKYTFREGWLQSWGTVW